MALDFRSLANSGVRNVTPYVAGKPIEALQRELGITSSIKLASNENPLGASPLVLEGLKAFVTQTHIYPDAECFELKAMLSQFLSLSSNQLTIGNGSENILELIIKAYLHKDDNAVLSQYAFLTIPILLQSYGVQANFAPAKNWGHDIPAMIAAINDKTRVLFLVNPNNPTGTYTHEKDFFHLMEKVPAHVMVVVDEAYTEYINTNDYPNTLKFLPHYPNLVIVRTFSKVYGLAGLRLGVALSSPEIADMLNRARLPFNVNAFSAKAGVLALMDQDHVKKSIALNHSGLAQVKVAIEAMGLNLIPSVGNFLTIDVHNGAKVYDKLLREGVIVRPLSAYAMPKHIRVTIGTAEQNERFLAALTKVLTSLKSDERNE